MIDQLRQSMRALETLFQAQGVTANNLANINTPGYKAETLFFNAFQKAVDGRTVAIPQAQDTTSPAVGEMQKTDNPLDVAINGKGFFLVNDDGRVVLSRDGRFHIDSEGFLRDSNNAYVQGKTGAIYLPDLRDGSPGAANAHLKIAKDGTISINGVQADKIQLAKVSDYDNLKRLGDSYMTTKDGSPPLPDTESTLSQGFYETSNVNPLKEMIAMTTNMRLFESQQRTMQSINEILGKVTTSLGKF